MKTTRHRGKTIDRVSGVKVIDCTACGFKHVVPFPSEEKLKELYEKEFYEHDKPNYFSETREDKEWWMATYASYFGVFEKLTKGRRILDIGSGPGYFLLCGKKRGWDAVGIEPSVNAVKYSRRQKLLVEHNFFTYESARQLGKFDVVHSSMVLEHVPDAVNFVKEMKKMLKPNGLLVIFCPNDYNPLQDVLRKRLKFKPWWVVPNHHLNYFDFFSIERFLKKQGFKIEDMLGTFPMEVFPLSGDNYVGNPKLGRLCHMRRKIFEMNLYRHNPDVLVSLYRDLAKSGMGREFLVIARKNR